MSSTRTTAHEIRSLPDLSLPRYFDLFGDEALSVCSTRLFSWLQLATTGVDPSVFALRFLYDPSARQAHRRLRIFVLTRSADDDMHASGILGQMLASETLALEEVIPGICRPADEDLRHLVLLERQASLVREGGDALFLPADWTRRDASRDAREPYLDEAFGALREPCFLEIQLHGCDPTAARRALRATIEQLERRRQHSSSLVDEQAAHLRTLADAVASDPCCHLLVCTGSRHRGTAVGLLRAFGVDAIGGSRFKVREPEDGEAQRLRAAIADLKYGFGDADGWYSDVLKQSLLLKPGTLSATQLDVLRAQSELAVLAGPDLIRDVLTLPVPRRGYLRTFALETEDQNRSAVVPPLREPGAVVLGLGLERGASVSLPVDDLSRHAFVAGVTGSGKTVTMFNILHQLGEEGVPFLVLEPAKTEYRALAGFSALRDGLQVFTPGRDDLSPLRLNPFRFPAHVSLAGHVAGLAAAFTTALDLFSPLSAILEGTLWDLYEALGWNEDDHGDARSEVPRVAELEEAICKSIEALGYDPEVRDRFRGAIRSRFIRMSRGSVGRLFDCDQSFPEIADLCGTQTVVELAALSPHEANLVSMFLLTSIREHMASGSSRKPGLVMVLVLEEAHNLVPAVPDQRSGEENDAKAEASRHVSNMLAEMRALGLGIIVVDQTPAAVSAQVVRNTNLKLAHRTVAREDRETLADAMLMHPAHAELLGRLIPGQAYAYSDRFYRPHLVQVPLREPEPISGANKQVAEVSAGSPSDDDLLGWMRKRTWYKRSVVNREQMFRAKVERLIERVIGLSRDVASANSEVKQLGESLATTKQRSSGVDDKEARFFVGQVSERLVQTCLELHSSLKADAVVTERALRSLEAEYRLLASAAVHVRPKRIVEDLVSPVRRAFDGVVRLVDMMRGIATAERED
jgi:DNA helicase HerA-like ATPase